ncbi:MAG: alpha/beta hydrolase family protein, partial [Planctomycetota bacterium]
LLVLLHGGNRVKERWEESGFVAALAPDDYHMLAIDIRGRGGSESGDADALRRDPTLPWADIEAALAWANSMSLVDANRIALVGSSYGANLATSGTMTHHWNVKTLVCFSATRMSFSFPDKPAASSARCRPGSSSPATRSRNATRPLMSRGVSSSTRRAGAS